MTDLMFDPPWTLLVGLAVGGAVLLFYGLTQGLRGLQALGVGVLAAAVVLFVTGQMVETGEEKVVRESGEFVAAADRRDWPAFSRLLDPQVKFASYGDRDSLTQGAAKTMDAVGVKNVTVNGFEVQQEPGGYIVTFMAYADVGAIAQRAPTSWKFFWAGNGTGGDYLLYRIEALRNGQFDPEMVTTRLVR